MKLSEGKQKGQKEAKRAKSLFAFLLLFALFVSLFSLRKRD
jgi:hypothetical protein